MDRNLEVYLQANFIAVCDRTDGFCSVTSKVVETHSVTLRRGISPTFTHIDGGLTALDSQSSAKTSSSPSGPSDTPPPS